MIISEEKNFTLSLIFFFFNIFYYVRLKERRNAAFELASLAATGEDAKKKIVDHEGYEYIFFYFFS